MMSSDFTNDDFVKETTLREDYKGVKLTDFKNYTNQTKTYSTTSYNYIELTPMKSTRGT